MLPKNLWLILMLEVNLRNDHMMRKVYFVIINCHRILSDFFLFTLLFVWYITFALQKILISWKTVSILTRVTKGLSSNREKLPAFSMNEPSWWHRRKDDFIEEGEADREEIIQFSSCFRWQNGGEWNETRLEVYTRSDDITHLHARINPRCIRFTLHVAYNLPTPLPVRSIDLNGRKYYLAEPDESNP